MVHRYLLTGCAGMIGSKVAELLLGEGHEVVGVDDLNDACDPRLKQWRLGPLAGHPQFRFHRLDINDRAALERLFRDDSAEDPSRPAQRRPYSGVINLAARAGTRPSVENPRICYETNCGGTLNLLELCRKHGVAKFLLASTSSLYGAHNPLPYREDADTDRPLSPYAASKKAAEMLCYAYHHLFKIDVSVLRYFTVYGPAGRPDMAVFRFVRQIAEGLPITVFGDGTQERDFTYVEDIARGTVAALRPLGFEVINLGGDRPLPLSAIIDQIATLTGRQPKIQRLPPHPADLRATWADVTKARRLLDWAPRVPVEEGLRRTVDWYRSHREFAGSIALEDDADQQPRPEAPL